MIEMGKGFIGYDEVTLIDDQVFTRERLNQWQWELLASYKVIFDLLTSQIDNASPVSFFLSDSLLQEVVVDATIGMRKLTNSDNNQVADPNAFKEAAYLAYWWLRHKPVSIHYPADFTLDSVVMQGGDGLSEEDQAIAHSKLVWRLKHVNELVATQFVLSYIFDFSEEVCGKRACARVAKRNENEFAFSSFDEMRTEAIDNLIYYFSYRAIAPKVIEQILEAYAFHPAWKLTGDLWNNGETKK